MNEENRLLYPAGAHLDERMFRINGQVSLRVLSISPAIQAGNIPFIILGGLATIADSLSSLLYEITKDFPVHYIETRDKSTSHIKGKVRYDIETMGMDVATIIQMLGLEEDKYILMGYSMGATIIADCFHSLNSRPRFLILLEPTPVFHYPKWSLLVIKWFGVPFFRIMKPAGKWYLGHFVINKDQDPEMAVISSRTLDHADPIKLRNTILDISGYTVWDKLGSILKPTLIIGTSKDKLHVEEEISRMVSAIAKCTYTDLETNKRSHSAELVYVIREYIRLLDK